MKILFTSPYALVPAHNGAALATLQTILSIQDRCELHLLVPIGGDDEVRYRAHREAFSRTRIHRYDPSIPRHLGTEGGPESALKRHARLLACLLGGGSWMASEMTRTARQFEQAIERVVRDEKIDVIHGEWLASAAALGRASKPVLFRTLDVHFFSLREVIALNSELKGFRRTLWELEPDRLRRFEVAKLRQMRRVVTLSNEDAELLRTEGLADVMVLPPPMPVPRDAAGHNGHGSERCTALFLGALTNNVNRAAFLTFTDSIWPCVPAEHRQRLKVIFAGKADAAALRIAEQSGVAIHESPSDEEHERLCEQADIFIAPLKVGTGIKIKTLTAMAHGKPIVGFPRAFRGIPAVHGRDVLIAHTNEEFASLMMSLAADRSRRTSLGRSARRLIETQFDPARLGERLVAEYRKLG